MLEPGQRLTLDLEAVAAEFGGQAAIHELDGHVFLELLVGAMGQIHGGHATGAEQTVDGVRPETHALRHRLHPRCVEQRARAVVRSQQRQHLLGVVGIRPVIAHEGLALGRREQQRVVEQGVDTCPAIWHDWPCAYVAACMRAISHARASVQSRSTVASDTPSASAVS